MSIIFAFVLHLILPFLNLQDSNSYILLESKLTQEIENARTNKSFQLVYDKAVGSDIPAYEMIKGSKKMEELIRNLEGTFQLPSKVSIRFASVDSKSPTYQDGEIIVPYNFFNYYLNFVIASGFGKTGKDKLAAVINVTQFVIIHELSHGMIDVLDVPFLGKEENVVDGLTVLLATKFDVDVVPLTAIDIYAHEAKVNNNALDNHMFWGKHSMDQDRINNMLCLVQGSNEGPNKNLFADINAESESQSECSKEYERINENWSRVFGSALK